MPASYDAQLADIQRAIGRIEGKLDEMAITRAIENVETADVRKSSNESRSSFDARLRTVEQRQHYYAGLSAAAGAFLAHFGIKLPAWLGS